LTDTQFYQPNDVNIIYIIWLQIITLSVFLNAGYKMETLLDQVTNQDEKLLSRRGALTKAGYLTLSAATMMILMKSQPAKAASVSNQSRMAAPNTSTTTNESWSRTTRQ